MARDQIEKQAEHLLSEHGFSRPPVDVAKLADQLQYRIVRKYFEEADLSGSVMRSNDGVITIGINTLHAHVRQRFSIAHEIGHAQLHLSKTRREELFVDPPVGAHFRDSRASLGEDPKEIAANQYAAALLMPAGLVKESLAKLAQAAGRLTIDNAVEKLAKDFDVSTQAMRFRLVSLGFIEPA